MKEKLKIARNLRISRKDFSKKHLKLFNKCYRAFIIECILKRKDTFKIKFSGKYIECFPKRVKDWLSFVWHNIYRFYLLHINTYKNDNTFRKYELVHYGVSVPVHPKVTNTPDEIILEYFLKENGFEIVSEHLGSVTTIYDIARI